MFEWQIKKLTTGRIQDGVSTLKKRQRRWFNVDTPSCAQWVVSAPCHPAMETPPRRRPVPSPYLAVCSRRCRLISSPVSLVQEDLRDWNNNKSLPLFPAGSACVMGGEQTSDRPPMWAALTIVAWLRLWEMLMYFELYEICWHTCIPDGWWKWF